MQTKNEKRARLCHRRRSRLANRRPLRHLRLAISLIERARRCCFFRKRMSSGVNTLEFLYRIVVTGKKPVTTIGAFYSSICLISSKMVCNPSFSSGVKVALFNVRSANWMALSLSVSVFGFKSSYIFSYSLRIC